MQSILTVTFPFFALVLLGWLAVRRHLLPESAIPGLNAFVLYFALPAMLFRFGASLPIGKLLNPALVGIHLSAALLLVGFTLALTLRHHESGRGVPMKDAAFGALVAAFPNSGFMGFPLLIGLLGEGIAGPVIGCILVDLVVTSSLCLGLAQLGPGGGGVAVFGRVLRGALVNPLPWAIALGALVQAGGVVLPGPLSEIVRMLGETATPVALFTIGAVLCRAQRPGMPPTPVAHVLPVAAIKLLLHPAVVLAGGLIAKALGASVTEFGLLVLVLNAALPSASNVAILAERYGADSGRITRIIMLSTAVAFLSFSAIAWGLGVRS